MASFEVVIVITLIVAVITTFVVEILPHVIAISIVIWAEMRKSSKRRKE